MGGLIEPSPVQESESHWRPIVFGLALVVAVVALFALLLREPPKTASQQHPYAANIRLSDLKMSAAQNFVGASVTYLDGTVANTGGKTVTQVTVHIVFKDSMGQVAQLEDVPLRVLQTTGPYPDTVNLASSPLAPSQSTAFRITLEHVSEGWNREYPEIQVTDAAVK